MKGELEVIGAPNNCSASILTGFPEDGYSRGGGWNNGWDKELVRNWIYRYVPLKPILMATTTSFMVETEKLLREMGWKCAKKCNKPGVNKSINLWYLDLSNKKLYKKYSDEKSELIRQEIEKRQTPVTKKEDTPPKLEIRLNKQTRFYYNIK